MTPFEQAAYEGTDFTSVEVAESEIRFKSFDACTFSRCRFHGTRFVECSFSACRFERCDLSLAGFPGCAFSGVVFQSSKLIGVNWTEANWQTVSLLKPLSFDDCTLNYSTFTGLNLRKLVLTRCVAHDVDLGDADLTGADCRQTDFTDSRFFHTNLTEADFTGARGYNIDAGTNRLKKTRFALPEAVALLRSLDIVLVEEDGDSDASR